MTKKQVFFLVIIGLLAGLIIGLCFYAFINIIVIIYNFLTDIGFYSYFYSL